MSNVQKYILTVSNNKDQAHDIAASTARDLESKKSTLIKVVESLGEYINDDDTTIRFKTIDYLSKVIGHLSTTFLSQQQIHVLCHFLCDRIEDGGAVGGLRRLASLLRFPKEMAQLTFRAMVGHFQDLQLRPQGQRLEILELLNDLMFMHREAIKQLRQEAIIGTLNIVSDEKDPRNLMVIFSILKVIMVEWDIADHAEALFESVFCYFPITFRPPPNDPFGITAQDLKNRLRDCVAASAHFAAYAFPQLIEKLDSTSPNVKKDVMQTITACVSSYTLDIVSSHSVTLWDSLKFEILNVQEEDLAREALDSLQAIAIRLSRELDSTDAKTPLARYLRPISKECNEQLQEPQHKQAKTAGQILSALGTASPIAFHLIVKAIVPTLNTLYQAADTISRQRALLEVLVQILDSAIAIYVTSAKLQLPLTVDSPLEPFKDRLFEITSQALMSTAADEVSFRVMALRALSRLCLLRKYLKDDEVGMAIQYFDEIILYEDPGGKEDLKNEAVRALVELSKLKPNLIIDITFPAFIAKLPDSSSLGNTDYLTTLESLAQLSVEKFVSDTLIRRLLSKLYVILENDNAPAYSQAILSTMYHVLGRRDLKHDHDMSSYHEKIVVGLISRAVHASTSEVSAKALTEESTLEILGRLVMIIVRALDEHKQGSIALQIYSLFADDGTFTPVPFREGVPKLQRSTMILSTALLAGVGRSISVQYAYPHEISMLGLLSELIRIAHIEEIPSIQLAILRQIGLLTNKFISNEETEKLVHLMRELAAGLRETTKVADNTVRILFWEAKGLILRLSHTEEVLEHLLVLLSNVHCGYASARGFGLLLAQDEILSKENGAILRLLAKQKVFNICIPAITKGFRLADTAIKPNYLVALSGLLKSMPTEVILPDIEMLLPLLLQSLDLEDSDVKTATIQGLLVISHENPMVIESHVSSLVSRLLKLTTKSSMNTVIVRHNALRCLRVFPGKIKDSALLPYKNAVTRGLLSVLDDPKRYVRKEAVDCKAAWLNMDELQSD